VIDWDQVMLAPKERDFIFVREPQAAAFFKGYGGKADVDQMALKSDWSEETRADNFKILDRILAGADGTIPAARAAESHLQSGCDGAKKLETIRPRH